MSVLSSVKASPAWPELSCILKEGLELLTLGGLLFDQLTLWSSFANKRKEEQIPQTIGHLTTILLLIQLT